MAFFFGSFTNVLIYRIPRNLSILKPGSQCPECKHLLKWYENIPIISYILLRGKCSNCSALIPARYPIVESILGILIWSYFPKLNEISEFFFIVILLSIVVALAFIDHDWEILPHNLTYTAIIISLVYILCYGSPFYTRIEAFSTLIKPIANLLSALSFYGISLFFLDSFTYFANKLFFRDKALVIVPSALTLRIEFLVKNISGLYLGLILVQSYLLSTYPLSYFFWFNAMLGISYLIYDIVLEGPLQFSQEKKNQTEEKNDHKTVLGGGDVAFISLITVVIGGAASFITVIGAFYIAFFYLCIQKLPAFFKTSKEIIVSQFNETNKSLSKNPHKSDLFKMPRHVPLGGALAIAFITAMMIL